MAVTAGPVESAGAEQAVAAGAELRTGINVERVEQEESGVTVRTATESLRARYVVGADGANGTTAKSLGLMARRHNGVALEGEIQVSSAALEKWRGKMLFDYGGIPWGYSWIFPKAEQTSSVPTTVIVFKNDESFQPHAEIH